MSLWIRRFCRAGITGQDHERSFGEGGHTQQTVSGAVSRPEIEELTVWQQRKGFAVKAVEALYIDGLYHPLHAGWRGCRVAHFVHHSPRTGVDCLIRANARSTSSALCVPSITTSMASRWGEKAVGTSDVCRIGEVEQDHTRLIAMLKFVDQGYHFRGGQASAECETARPPAARRIGQCRDAPAIVSIGTSSSK